MPETFLRWGRKIGSKVNWIVRFLAQKNQLLERELHRKT
jgi:hypothetical protein